MDNRAYLKLMGGKIKAVRKANKMSLTLSKLCKTDMSNLWFIEKGQRNVHILTLKSIADVFEMDIKEFM